MTGTLRGRGLGGGGVGRVAAVVAAGTTDDWAQRADLAKALLDGEDGVDGGFAAYLVRFDCQWLGGCLCRSHRIMAIIGLGYCGEETWLLT